jgi:histone-binding protein RBBP4
MDGSDLDAAQCVEDKLISEEYRVWKKNTPFLYDFILTHALDWPSLTVQWLPDEGKSASAADLVNHKLIIGTQSDESAEAEANYLMIADVLLPSQDAPVDARAYNRDKNELGNYAGTSSKVQVKVKMVTEGDVHRARYQPQNPFVIAVKSPKPDLLVYNYSKHSSLPPDLVCRPQHRLKGHSDGGYGVAWNPLTAGLIASASTDGSICLWDTKEAAMEVNALHTFRGHDGGVEDVDWSRHHASLFGTVGGDGKMLIWDLREASSATSTDNSSVTSGKPRFEAVSNAEDTNCISFNPFNETILATGGSDGIVKLWDLRNLSSCTHECVGHKAGVYQLSWSPFEEAILASSGEDRRVIFWDTCRIGQEQDPEDAEDGPPELLFIHGGHTAKVFDFSWNQNYHWCMASVAEDNILQVWQVAEGIYDDSEEKSENGAEAADEDLEDDDEHDRHRNKRPKL